MTSLPPYADPEVRRQSIGSSDIGVILGVSKFLSPVQLYMQKRGELPPSDESEAMYWGTVLEPVVAARYTEDTGLRLQRINQTQRHKLHDWATCHIDRKVIGQPKLVEIKTGGIWVAKDYGPSGTNEIPDSHMAQVQWQMGINELPFADVAVLIGGQRFQIHPIDYDAELFAMMLEQAKEFWARVKEGNPPDPESEADCKALWPRATRSVVAVSAHIVNARDEYWLCKRRAEEAKLVIQQAIGDHEIAQCDDQVLATYKNTSSTRFDQSAFKRENPELHKKYLKTTTGRRLLIKERKDD